VGSLKVDGDSGMSEAEFRRVAHLRAGARVNRDTVSRALAGGDENGSDAMGQFVAACDAIKRHVGGALLGVHHSGKDKDRGMRGSSVLLGACDAAIRVTKTEHIVTLKTEKQKDAEEAAPIYMELRKRAWAEGLGKEETTLVPFRSEAPAEETNNGLSNEQITRSFGLLADAWGDKNALSLAAQTRDQGRYAPDILTARLGADARIWQAALRDWLANGCLSVEEYDSHAHKSGLRVLNPIIKGG
jgi:hypothetical protein